MLLRGSSVGRTWDGSFLFVYFATGCFEKGICVSTFVGSVCLQLYLHTCTYVPMFWESYLEATDFARIHQSLLADDGTA